MLTKTLLDLFVVIGITEKQDILAYVLVFFTHSAYF